MNIPENSFLHCLYTRKYLFLYISSLNTQTHVQKHYYDSDSYDCACLNVSEVLTYTGQAMHIVNLEDPAGSFTELLTLQ